MAEGMANANDGSSGCDNCRVKRVVNLDALEMEDVDSRGRKVERIEDVVVWTAAIVLA